MDIKNSKPEWIKTQFQPSKTEFVHSLLHDLKLNTVCQSANCPNLGECFQRQTATFMVLGKICTHRCPYCDVPFGRPETIDPDEPEKIAIAVRELKLKHVVVTSVCRDDLPDGGAEHFRRVIDAVHRDCPGTTVEVLIPDFKGNVMALNRVLDSMPEVLNHNVETVPELYKQVRPQGVYQNSLAVLRRSREFAEAKGIGYPVVKTGVMLGLGETDEQVYSLFADLLEHGCEVLTLGQYLRPSPAHLPVVRYLKPSEFDAYRQRALEMGFAYVAASSLVRSSYRAETALAEVLKQKSCNCEEGCVCSF